MTRLTLAFLGICFLGRFSGCLSQDDGLSNIALGKDTFQSSTATEWVGSSSRAVDGDTEARYHDGNTCTHTQVDVNAWWAVDLGATHRVTHVDVYNRIDCCAQRTTGLTLVVSDVALSPGDSILDLDAQACAALSGDPEPLMGFDCECGAIGRYVYLYLPGEEALTLCEVEIFGYVESAENLALNQVTSQSSTATEWVGSSSRAVDGDTEARYHDGNTCTHTEVDMNAWWSVDLGSSVDVVSVLVYNRVDCCDQRTAGLTVVVTDEETDDPTSLETNCGSLVGPSTPEMTFDCDCGAIGRYVYLYLPAEEALTLCEVQVTGRVAV